MHFLAVKRALRCFSEFFYEAENLAMADPGIENLSELVRLTAKLTENMEKQFAHLA